MIAQLTGEPVAWIGYDGGPVAGSGVFPLTRLAYDGGRWVTSSVRVSVSPATVVAVDGEGGRHRDDTADAADESAG
ncbi:hypothetical protein GCM10027059_20960 [Myceligenerans halotolerans]